ncbi:Transposase [Oopsacas minuta]|uniref:Transposase n=1 Tax=Oopsacas minuta TaxID=111878 RepID=A0AAV7JW20_9METZ|nr:Transposase [Oopsacas minuta]
MFYNYKRGISAIECIIEIFSVFGEQSLTKTNIYKWYNRFRLGYMCLDDDDIRTGRPITATTDENITKVEELVREDRQITIRQLIHDASVSSGTIETILHQHLGLRRVCSKLVPHLLTLEQKNRQIQFCRSMLLKYSKAYSRRHSEVITGDETWVYFYDMQTKQQSSKSIFEDEVPDTIPKRFMVVGKRMFAIFFTTRGLLEFVMLPAKHTVTAAWYTECCLPKVFQAVETL